MSQSSSSSFWDRAIVVAVVSALLGGAGYFIKEFVIEKDNSDLVVRAEEFQQIVPLSQQQPTYQNNTVYCEAVRYHLIISHNQKGKKPIRLKRLSLETEQIVLDEETKARLVYKLDASATLGFGIIQLKEYAFAMDGNNIKGSYLESRQKAIKVDPNNVFRSTKGTHAITIEKDGDFAFLQSVIVLEAFTPGLYKARICLDYEIGGNIAKEEVTPWVYVLML